MEASNGPSKNALLLMFGLPILQTAIICASMYAGHVLTKRMDRQQAAKNAPATVQPAATQVSIAPPATLPMVSAPVSVQTPVAPVVTPIVAAEPRVMAASSIAPSKPVEKPEIASMNRAVEKLAPATTQVKVAEKPKAYVRPVQKPVTIPLIRPVEKPAAIPTPLLVPKKDPQKTTAIQIDADDAATKVHLRDTRPSPTVTALPKPIQKPVQQTVQLDAPVVPAAVATPVATPAVVVPAPVVAPANPAPRVSPEPAVVVELPKAETGGDVATAEPVRRAPVVAPKPVEPAPQPVQAVRPAPAPVAPVADQNDVRGNEGRMILASSPVQPVTAGPAAHSHLLLGRPVRDEDLSLDLLYALSTKYVDAYCMKKGLNPADETKRWMKRWMDNVEQAMYDGDSSEQQYINRVTIAKRDCFNIEKAAVDKVVEGCRILLRYRDGNFTWLSAMREALTRENLKKTLVFLNAGPQI